MPSCRPPGCDAGHASIRTRRRAASGPVHDDQPVSRGGRCHLYTVLVGTSTCRSRPGIGISPILRSSPAVRPPPCSRADRRFYEGRVGCKTDVAVFPLSVLRRLPSRTCACAPDDVRRCRRVVPRDVTLATLLFALVGGPHPARCTMTNLSPGVGAAICTPSSSGPVRAAVARVSASLPSSEAHQPSGRLPARVLTAASMRVELDARPTWRSFRCPSYGASHPGPVPVLLTMCGDAVVSSPGM